MIKERNNELFEKDYFKDLQEIKEAIRTNQNKAMVIVNSAMIMTYYEIGTIINKRKTWGSKYIKNLANDLKEYGKGYSYDQLKRMAQFANEFSRQEIGAQLFLLCKSLPHMKKCYGISMRLIKMVGLDLWY